MLWRISLPKAGALLGGVAAATYVLAGVIAETELGRPSSTSGLAYPFAIIWGGVAALAGAAVGELIRRLFARRRASGTVDFRIVGVLLVLAALASSATAKRQVEQYERANQPRAVATTRRIVRATGATSLLPVSPATRIWVALPDDGPIQQLLWNGRTVDVTVEDDELRLRAGDIVSAPINLDRLDYAREVHAAIATLDGGSAEWLALLVRLRATGSRELLTILSPDGALAHHELLERFTGLTDEPVLWSAGPPTERQEFVVDVGRPTRYGSSR